MLQNIDDSCRYLLKNYPSAQGVLEYLNTRVNENSLELFQFGYFPGPEDLVALTSLIKEDNLIKHKLLFTRIINDSLYPRTIKLNGKDVLVDDIQMVEYKEHLTRSHRILFLSGKSL